MTHSGLSGGVEVALLAALLGVVGLRLGVFGVDSSISNCRALFGMVFEIKAAADSHFLAHSYPLP